MRWSERPMRRTRSKTGLVCPEREPSVRPQPTVPLLPSLQARCHGRLLDLHLSHHAGRRESGAAGAWAAGVEAGGRGEREPVGSYRPNGFELYDMRGNVFEWCADWYAWGYYRHSPQDDPPGPSSASSAAAIGASPTWAATTADSTPNPGGPTHTSVSASCVKKTSSKRGEPPQTCR
ncbi:MAG: SUMF1/EgtB/PvdO family nonheme iron enzyme [Planctomycetes bacterium]|nr:SUMF1/EgtB/PvdO family nonheme iron enzyme [Planctomycetota bacterium]